MREGTDNLNSIMDVVRVLHAVEGEDASAKALSRVLSKTRSDGITVATKADEMVTMRGFNEVFKAYEFDACLRFAEFTPTGDTS